MSTLDRVPERIPFTGRGEDCDWLTYAGLRTAADNPDNVFGAVLGLLAGFHDTRFCTFAKGRGASYAQLRAVADGVGMTQEQALEWELPAESIPLAERHVLHILGTLAEVAA